MNGIYYNLFYILMGLIMVGLCVWMVISIKKKLKELDILIESIKEFQLLREAIA